MHQSHSYTSKDQSRTAIVFFDAETDEFTVCFYLGNVYQVEADYFTDDEDDADSTAQHFVDSAPPAPVELTNAEFCALVGPLVERNVYFELALPGHVLARLTWNGGDTVHCVYHNGEAGRVSLAASQYKPAGLAALETICAMEAP